MPTAKRSFCGRAEPQLSVDVPFSYRLSAPSVAAIITDLLKYLVFQRKQIPFQYEMVSRDVRDSSRDRHDVDEQPCEASDNPRAAARQRRERQRRRVLRERYLKRAEKFLLAFDALLRGLEEELAADIQGDISCVSFLFGATPVSPKEVFHVYPPKRDPDDRDDAVVLADRARKQAAIPLFRAIVTNEKLFDRVGKPMASTNLYVALKRRSPREEPSDWLMVRPEFANLQRGKVTEFRLHHTANGLKTPIMKKSLVYTSAETFTPIPMNLCTPGGELKRARLTPVKLCVSSTKKSVEEEEWERINGSEMVETPCVKRTPLYQRGGCSNRDAAATSINCEPLPVEGDEWFVSILPVKGFKDPQVQIKGC